MPLSFHNSLTRRREEFVPLDPPRVGLYVCGPTVYAAPHIGNLRTFFFADVLHRHLEYRGYDVKYVMNLTDVDDKTIAGAEAAGIPLPDYTAPFVDSFFADLDALGIQRADAYPRATAHVGGMVELIGRLVDRGLAYAADGAVYYDISAFPAYGKLSGVDLEAGRRGERVAADEYDKEDARDFALWKAAQPRDERVGAAWDTPWGRGRPGWHLECSVMSMAELGETLDIHAGGVDLLFPHHEDEIAQSEGATGEPFARYWLHAEHLLVEGEKMAKSRGNFYTLNELRERGVEPAAIRYVFLSTHYRGKLNFTFDALQGAAATVRRIRTARDRLRDHPAVVTPGPEDLPVLHERAGDALGAFGSALDDDLNTSVALAALHSLIDSINSRLDAAGGEPISEAEQAAAATAIATLDSVFGLLELADRAAGAVDPDLTGWVEKRLRERAAARDARDFARADGIRDELAARGVRVEDTPTGTRWTTT